MYILVEIMSLHCNKHLFKTIATIPNIIWIFSRILDSIICYVYVRILVHCSGTGITVIM